MSEKNILSVQDERLNILHKKILEMKKKILLIEGQRKSWFEESNSRRKENTQKLLVLKKEVKILHAEPQYYNVDENTKYKTYFNNINPTDSKKVITNYEKEKQDELILRLRKTIDYMICNREKKKNTLYNMLSSYTKAINNKKLKHAWKELGFAHKQFLWRNQQQKVSI
ncbi:uncharacterized protein LOC127288013 [Leptopilina boulardi]|uniref:uncharacterized protein LOC127288013 n=1 Tax=Leptopilina boulardi TaxID=63433 RepID=UPI0021F63D68|nr:uncharacterized protein LOC127288013 [Leptopilina boulardi]